MSTIPVTGAKDRRCSENPFPDSGHSPVHRRGLEPPRPCGHQPLKLARLPIPPSVHKALIERRRCWKSYPSPITYSHGCTKRVELSQCVISAVRAEGIEPPQPEASGLQPGELANVQDTQDLRRHSALGRDRLQKSHHYPTPTAGSCRNTLWEGSRLMKQSWCRF